MQTQAHEKGKPQLYQRKEGTLINILNNKLQLIGFPFIHEFMNKVRKKNNNFTTFWLQLPPMLAL